MAPAAGAELRRRHFAPALEELGQRELTVDRTAEERARLDGAQGRELDLGQAPAGPHHGGVEPSERARWS